MYIAMYKGQPQLVYMYDATTIVPVVATAVFSQLARYTSSCQPDYLTM